MNGSYLRANLRRSSSFLSSIQAKPRWIPISRVPPTSTSTLTASNSTKPIYSTSSSSSYSISRGYATSTTTASSPQDPSETQALEMLQEGTQHLEAGRIKEAQKAYQTSLKIKQTSSAAFNLGVTKYHQKDLDGAIEAWQLSLKISPDSPDAHTNLASAYVLAKPSRPDLAVKHLKTAANLAPSDPEIQYNLGAVLEALEQLEEALKAYKEAKMGGIERADQNIRNCQAKIMAAKLQARAQESKKSEEK